MKDKPKLHILYDYQLNIYLTVDSVFKYSQKMNKGLTQNSNRKLKVMRQFYVDSENFMKKY